MEPPAACASAPRRRAGEETVVTFDDDRKPTADLTRLSVKDVADREGDPVLEATLERLQREAEQPREAVSGFASAI